MKHIKLFENFQTKSNNQEGTLITFDDIIKCIKHNGSVYSEIIKNAPNNDKEEPLKPLDIDEDGLITVEYDNNEYEVRLKDVIKIEY